MDPDRTEKVRTPPTENADESVSNATKTRSVITDPFTMERKRFIDHTHIPGSLPGAAATPGEEIGYLIPSTPATL